MKTIHLSLEHRPHTTCVTGSQTVHLFLPLIRPRPHTTLQLALCCVYVSRLFSPSWFPVASAIVQIVLRHTICYIYFLARFQPSYFLVALLASRSFLLTHNFSIVAFSRTTTVFYELQYSCLLATYHWPSLNYCSRLLAKYNRPFPVSAIPSVYIFYQSMIRFSKHYRPVT